MFYPRRTARIREIAVHDVTVACSMAESWDDRTRETVKKIPLLSVRTHDVSLHVSLTPLALHRRPAGHEIKKHGVYGSNRYGQADHVVSLFVNSGTVNVDSVCQHEQRE